MSCELLNIIWKKLLGFIFSPKKTNNNQSENIINMYNNNGINNIGDNNDFSKKNYIINADKNNYPKIINNIISNLSLLNKTLLGSFLSKEIIENCEKSVSKIIEDCRTIILEYKNNIPEVEKVCRNLLNYLEYKETEQTKAESDLLITKMHGLCSCQQGASNLTNENKISRMDEINSYANKLEEFEKTLKEIIKYEHKKSN